MGKKPFKIKPERRVGKTQILLDEDPEKLENLKQKFNQTRSSEVYPCLEENYDYSLFFYETKEAFLKKLHKFAKNNFSGLKARETRSKTWLIKWGLIGPALLFVLYFIYRFILAIISATYLVKG